MNASLPNFTRVRGGIHVTIAGSACTILLPRILYCISNCKIWAFSWAVDLRLRPYGRGLQVDNGSSLVPLLLLEVLSYHAIEMISSFAKTLPSHRSIALLHPTLGWVDQINPPTRFPKSEQSLVVLETHYPEAIPYNPYLSSPKCLRRSSSHLRGINPRNPSHASTSHQL